MSEEKCIICGRDPYIMLCWLPKKPIFCKECYSVLKGFFTDWS